MATGRVKWFNAQKGFGFVAGDDGRDYFVHYSAIVGEGYRQLEQGQRVEFDVEEDPRGPKAVKVKVAAS